MEGRAVDDAEHKRRPAVIVRARVPHDFSNCRGVVIFDAAAESISEQLLRHRSRKLIGVRGEEFVEIGRPIKGRAVGLYALVCINSDIRNGGQSNEARQDTLKYAAASVELFERENEDVPPAQYWILSWAYRQLGEHNRAEQFALQAIRAATGDNSINAFFVTCCFSVAVNRSFSDDVCLAAFNIARSRSAGQLRHLMKPYGIERNYPVTSTQRSGIGTALQDMKRGFKDGIADIVGGGSKEGVAEMIKEEVLKAVVQAFISSIIGS